MKQAEPIDRKFKYSFATKTRLKRNLQILHFSLPNSPNQIIVYV